MGVLLILKVLNSDNKNDWNNIVKSFTNWDVYYLFEYAHSFKCHGDGEPLLIDYQDDESHFCYVVMKRDIADDVNFKNILKRGLYYDFETPYGYGGPLCDSSITDKSQSEFIREISQYANENRIVEQFVRFHPILRNDTLMPIVFDMKYLHDTVYIDTSTEEAVFKNMSSKNRNMVRKAQKNGVSIIIKSVLEYNDFITMYEKTMLRKNAADYYFFEKKYFELQKHLRDNACFFYAVKDNMPVSGALMYYNHNYMHYHLSGTLPEYRKYGCNNLLLYEDALWAAKNEIKKFHLGGGITEDDSLFLFKIQFNKNGILPFVIGKTVFDKNSYDDLMKIRLEENPKFDINNKRMTQYRA